MCVRAKYHGARFALVILLGVGVLFPTAAAAVGEPQENRLFATVGGRLVLEEFARPFPAILAEAGYVGLLGPGFAVAPTASFGLFPGFPLIVCTTCRNLTRFTMHFLGGLKVGHAGDGFFAYGQFHLGLQYEYFRSTARDGTTASGSDTWLVFRVGTGADYVVWRYLAVGANLGIAITGRRGPTFEAFVYVKLLVPRLRITRTG